MGVSPGVRAADRQAVLVFISHATADAWIAEQLGEEVRKAGADYFLEVVDVEVGDDFDERILNGLEQCTELVVLLTPASIESRWVWLEIGSELGKRKRVSAIVHGMAVDDLLDDKLVPIVLKRKQMVHLNEAGRYFEELRGRVEGAS